MSFTAKSVILDIADNWEGSSYTWLRSLDFIDAIGGVLPCTYDVADIYQFIAYQSSSYNSSTLAKDVFQYILPKTGPFEYGWASAVATGTNQRIIAVFTTAITFDGIIINNGHNGGGWTGQGVKNVKIHVSTDAITNLTYDAAISNSTKIYDSTFDEHVASDIADPQILDFYGDKILTSPEILIPSVPASTISVVAASPEILISTTVISGVFSGLYTVSSEILTPSVPGSIVNMCVSSPEILTPSVPGSIVSMVIPSPEILSPSITDNQTFFNGLVISDPEVLTPTNVGSIINLAISTPDILTQSGVESIVSMVVASPEVLTHTGPADSYLSMFTTDDAILHYYLTITGSPDIEIPITSFQARRRSGDPTYLSVVIPDIDIIDEITVRSSGTMKIEQGYERAGVELQRETIIETAVDTVNTYQGGTNQSIVLMGYTTSTFSPQTLDLSGSTYRAIVNGKITHRLARSYIFLNPGALSST